MESCNRQAFAETTKAGKVTVSDVFEFNNYFSDFGNFRLVRAWNELFVRGHIFNHKNVLVMSVHQFKMHEFEWRSFFLGFKSSMLMQPDVNIAVGDVIILSEIVYVRAQETGNHLVYELKSIDRNAGRIEGEFVWNLELERISNYDVRKGLKKAGRKSLRVL